MILYPPDETVTYPIERLEFITVAFAATLIVLIVFKHLWKNDPRR